MPRPPPVAPAPRIPGLFGNSLVQRCRQVKGMDAGFTLLGLVGVFRVDLIRKVIPCLQEGQALSRLRVRRRFHLK